MEKTKNLDDYLTERENQIEIEKQKYDELLVKHRAAQEEYIRKFQEVVSNVIEPAMTELEKKFRTKGHELQLDSRSSSTPSEMIYKLTMNEGNKREYKIYFLGHRGKTEVLFMFSTVPSYERDDHKQQWSFEDVTKQNIEHEIVSALNYFNLRKK